MQSRLNYAIIRFLEQDPVKAGIVKIVLNFSGDMNSLVTTLQLKAMVDSCLEFEAIK
jgi:hypothetical protein